MWLTRAVIKANLIAEMTQRFPARHGVFPESLKIADLGFPNQESLREWGKSLNRATWFTGWFTPSEFLACVTLGRVPNSDKPNLIDLMFNTQTRPPEQTAAETPLVAAAKKAAAKKPSGKAKREKKEAQS